jgi:succinylarginine dihydrolase
MAQFLRVGLDDEQRAALPPGLQASPHATAALREWALREAPERLGVDHLAEADVRARLAEAFAGLMQVLQLS